MDGDDSPTPLSLPPSLPYPLTITRILVRTGDELQRGTHLVEYKFTSATSRKALERKARGQVEDENPKDAKEWDMVGTWDAEFEGKVVALEAWLSVGEVIERKSAGKSAVVVKRPCDHSVQFGGLCAKCGIPLDVDDYLSRPEESSQAGPSSKKGYTMSHDAMGVTVSTNEAKRIENQSRNALLQARKLTLIVDLDQTIIHTTVDPTVGEWMADVQDGTAGDAKPAEGQSTTPPSSPRRPKEINPNTEALGDVARFQLDDDLPPGYSRENAKKNLPTDYDRWYYTKPRPGLSRFLRDMSDIYEMHVYTMGTRTYADAVCKAVDPAGSIFGGRILTRDESGSFNVKDLKRLFPTDQSMVVIIDDRSDVWSDVPNLVKVVPYDFFIGQGDINAPKTNALTPPLPPSPSPSSPSDSAASENEANKVARSKLLDELSEKRPLAKLQEELEREPPLNGDMPISDAEQQSDPSSGPSQITENGTVPLEEIKTTMPPGSPKPRRPVLNNDDHELERVAKILSRVHQTFYLAYDSRYDKSINARLPLECDVPTIIPEIKAGVLEGCRIVFSGVIPTHVRPETSDIWRQAETFGATPSSTITPNTTHCVIALEGTEKAMRAFKMGVRVVWVDWFHRCIALWERLPEDEWSVRDPKREKEKGVETRPSSETNTPRTSGLQLRSMDGETSELNDHEQPEGDEPDDLGGEWDDDEFLASIKAEAGLDDDALDMGSENGTDRRSSPPRSILASPRSRGASVESVGSIPGTPRKRVRYADEEHRPLTTYREPPKGSSVSPPRKKPRALLMPSNGNEVPPENVFRWKGKASGGEAEQKEVVEDPSQGENEAEGEYEQSEAGTEDEFSRMLREEMDEGE